MLTFCLSYCILLVNDSMKLNLKHQALWVAWKEDGEIDMFWMEWIILINYLLCVETGLLTEKMSWGSQSHQLLNHHRELHLIRGHDPGSQGSMHHQKRRNQTLMCDFFNVILILLHRMPFCCFNPLLYSTIHKAIFSVLWVKGSLICKIICLKFKSENGIVRSERSILSSLSLSLSPLLAGRDIEGCIQGCFDGNQEHSFFSYCLVCLWE